MTIQGQIMVKDQSYPFLKSPLSLYEGPSFPPVWAFLLLSAIWHRTFSQAGCGIFAVFDYFNYTWRVRLGIHGITNKWWDRSEKQRCITELIFFAVKIPVITTSLEFIIQIAQCKATFSCWGPLFVWAYPTWKNQDVTSEILFLKDSSQLQQNGDILRQREKDGGIC